MKDELDACYSLFQQPWWLNIVAGEAWEEVTVTKGGQIRARLPYLINNKLGATLSIMPPLTPRLGPWIAPQNGKYVTQLTNEKRLLEDLVERLPRLDYFKQNFHPQLTNWLPFYWAGFKQTTRYSYIIKDIRNPDDVWSEIKGNIRREIRKAKEILTIQEEANADLLWQLHNKTFERQNDSPNQSEGMVQKITCEVLERECGKVLAAYDDQGQPHAAILVVWDANSAYYLMGGADPELRNSGASSYLLWQAINTLSGATNSFDFEGSMIQSIERFFRAFGARQVPYFQITRKSKKMKSLLNIKSLFDPLTS